MVQIDELKIMNYTMINYLKKLGMDAKRNEIIQEIFKDDACFFKMSKNDALLILNEVGVKENIEEIYSNLISSDTFYNLYDNGKIDEKDPDVIIKYKIYDCDNLFNKQNKVNRQSEKHETSLIENKKYSFWNNLFNKLKKFFTKK